MTNMPICKQCGVQLHDGTWRNGDKRKRYYLCNICARKKAVEYNKKWLKTPNGKLYISHRIQKRRLTVLKHYSPNLICQRCGDNEIDVLSMDHIKGGGKKHLNEIGGGPIFYRWLFRNNFPEGYQVLCMNCQFIKRHENWEIENPGRPKRFTPEEWVKHRRGYMRNYMRETRNGARWYINTKPLNKYV